MSNYIEGLSVYNELPSEEVRSNWKARDYVKLLKLHPELYRDLPDRFKTMKSVIEVAIEGDSRNLWYVPDEAAEKLNLDKSGQLPFVVKRYALDTSNDIQENSISIAPKNNNLLVIDNPDEPCVRTIYYISDLHIEHQVDIENKSLDEITAQIGLKAKELVESLTDDRGIIIFAGDIADSPELANIFYSEFSYAMSMAGCHHGPYLIRSPWRVIAVAGNHELWDADPYGVLPVRSPERVVKDMRVVHNQLLFDYKGYGHAYLLNENELLEMLDSELRTLVLESTFTLLGGVGFTGNNNRFNATAGVYGVRALEGGTLVPRISLQEDIEQSRRFEALHNKLVRCASDLPLVVVTHTPISDWTNEQPNPGWIYIHGHTHHNQLIRSEDGVNIFGDNQVGYEPKEWRFKAFTHRYLFDPFEEWADGIYEITPQQYRDFSHGRGIEMQFRREIPVTMLKREGAYMFLMKTSRGLRMLAGGQAIVVNHSISYYYENLGKYRRCVESAFEPFRSALKVLSKEVRAFGGSGTIHGCIVDVDWYNHIYLNPLDGKVSAYEADNIVEKRVFPSVQAMLAGTAYESRYQKAIESGEVDVLAEKNIEDKALAQVPEVVLDTDMYRSSRIVRSVQYLFDKGVIRIWNDEVFGPNVPEDKMLLEEEEKKRRDRKRKAIAAPKPKPLSPEEKQRKRAELYVAKVSDRSAGKLEVDLDSYKGGKDSVTVHCKVCGYTWTKRADRLLERCYCPICRKTTK